MGDDAVATVHCANRVCSFCSAKAMFASGCINRRAVPVHYGSTALVMIGMQAMDPLIVWE